MKIIILTAEARNFVPIELLKAAQSKGLDASIVDITKIVIDESLQTGSGGGFWLLPDGEDEGLGQLHVDADTIVIPRLNEHHLDTKINILKKMENYGALLLNTADGMELCNDKLMSQLVLNRAGLTTPRSWVIQDADCFDRAIGELDKRGAIKFPIIVKTFRGTHGIGVMKLDSKSSLVSVGQTLLKEGIDFMLQEFIKHDQSCRIIMKGHELLAANLRGQPKEKDEFRTNSHLGSETQPYNPSEEELKVGQQIVELFGTTFCAIDYIIVDRVTKGDELPATEGLKTGHIHVMGESALKWNAYSGRWLRMTLTEEETQKVVDSQLQEGRNIVVLEVNGSPGLEAMSKNWPDRNLAAEVVDFAVQMHEASQASNAPKEPESATVELSTNPDEPMPTQAEADTLKLVEPIVIHRVIDEPVAAKVDTGAKTSTLHVDDVHVDGETVRFTRGETTYRVPLSDIRHVKSHDNTDESVTRPIVKLDVTVHGIRVNGAEFSLVNRSHMKYEVLIGRNMIEQLGLPVEIDRSGEEVAAPESQVEVEEE